MENFPSNSQRPIRPQEGPKVERIVTSEVRRRKTPLGRRMTQNFIGGDVQGTWGFVVGDIVVPTIRDLLLDVIRGGAERLIFPDSAPNRRARGYGGGPVNYAGLSSRSARPEPQQTRRGRSSYDIDDLLFNNRAEAMEIMDRLEFYLDRYGQASVSDLYGLVGIPSTHVDTNWGWTDLSSGHIRHVKDGYLLMLPRPESFK